MAAAQGPPSRADGLNVIALVSGGKDSFFSLLHCRANGHRVVALANLHPAVAPPLRLPGAPSAVDATTAAPAASAAVSAALLAPDGGPSSSRRPDRGQDQDQEGGQGRGACKPLPKDEQDEQDEQDLNSFMYQTVGHEVIPLYAEATGIPLYRRAIVGGAGLHGKDYSHFAQAHPVPESMDHVGEDPDETESMIPLLRAVMAAHPEANAISAGAILSTYQRTRVESVATRLGLVPLAFLWKFPILPVPSTATAGDAQLLDDMAAVRLEARIIKVASGGLDDSFLWTNVASAGGKHRIAAAMRRFGVRETGAVIGEGGEFETLVLDGPFSLFRKRIVVAEEDRQVIREGGGTAWLKLCNAVLETKNEKPTGDGDVDHHVRILDLLDVEFSRVLDAMHDAGAIPVAETGPSQDAIDNPKRLWRFQGHDRAAATLQQWCFVGDSAGRSTSTEAETTSVVDQIRQRLRRATLAPSAIISTTILLRHMADFPAVNAIYGSIFDAPNPPSRVTVSCGDLLSPASHPVNIAVYLTVHSSLQPGQRQGLHVQSWSYWAPANIGPYSQAIAVPVASLVSKTSGADTAIGGGPRLVSVAGQIPLVPATMTLPPPSAGDGLEYQLVLSLQHLWRIGLETGVQWWGSAVVYFPRSTADPNGGSVSSRARLAARAWETAHLGSRDEGGDTDGEEDESGPDLWDRKFDPRYVTLGGEESAPPVLPEWSVLVDEGPQSRKLAVPPLFAAEVADLPRGAGAEWHAHVGFAGMPARSIAMHRSRAVLRDGGEDGTPADVYQTIVRSEGGANVAQTVVAERLWAGDDKKERSAFGDVDHAAKLALARLGGVSAGEVELIVTARYVDAGRYLDPLGMNGDDVAHLGPVVPCASLWDSEGRALASVAVYQSIHEDERESPS